MSVLRLTALCTVVLLPLAPPPVVAGACEDYSDSWGFGGQHASCTFTCEMGDAVSIAVESDDRNAWVRGLARCGEGEAGCSGTWKCNGIGGPARERTAGTCGANSNEFWDSGIQVRCSTRGKEAVFGLPPVPCTRACPAATTEALPSARELLVTGPPADVASLVQIDFEEGGAFAVACVAGLGCRAVAARCETDAHGVRCSAPS